MFYDDFVSFFLSKNIFSKGTNRLKLKIDLKYLDRNIYWIYA